MRWIKGYVGAPCLDFQKSFDKEPPQRFGKKIKAHGADINKLAKKAGR